ncbi:hypothetical protein JW766_06530 [Candidatus Dojkabacteria bacterium]|nr:hypothetical protein [Candidatus Dojkabacteria bacterium]
MAEETIDNTTAAKLFAVESLSYAPFSDLMVGQVCLLFVPDESELVGQEASLAEEDDRGRRYAILDRTSLAGVVALRFRGSITLNEVRGPNGQVLKYGYPTQGYLVEVLKSDGGTSFKVDRVVYIHTILDTKSRTGFGIETVKDYLKIVKFDLKQVVVRRG